MINNQYSRAIPAQEQQQQQQNLNSQQNVFISDSTALMHNVPQQLSEAALYFHHQQPPQLNMNPINHIHTSHYENSHSIMASIHNGIHHQQQTTINPSTAAMCDPRLARVYTTANGLAAVSSSSNANLLENTLSSTSIPSHQSSNTILIDNFAPPQIQNGQSQQQIYRNSNQISQHFPHSSLQQLQHSNIARQQQQTQRDSEHNAQHHTHHFEHNVDVATTSNPTKIMHLNNLPTSNQTYYLSAEALGTANSNGKMSAYLPFKVNSTFPSASSFNEMYQRQLQPTTNTAVANATAPVVLDRINICINNHYTDPNFSSPIIDTAASSLNSLADTPSLSSPIIPPIQHSAAVIDQSLLLEPDLISTQTTTSTNTVTSVLSTLNEPDSTTTSHTPPATPDNTIPIFSNVNAIQSPSTSSTAKVDESFTEFSACNVKTDCADAKLDKNSTIAEAGNENFEENLEEDIDEVLEVNAAQEELSNMTTTNTVTKNMFTIGDDVFVKIDDDRLYLGTVIDTKYQRFRVRFDDASEMWCSPNEMRKFGICEDSNTLSGTGAGERSLDDSGDSGALCVACKKRDLIDVEICERCGRGYHKTCTRETAPGSGEWLCKRCSKSMKVDPSENVCDVEFENCSATTEQRRYLPYDVNSLHWDSKHRVNEEQVYCYCGKTGQFDLNMLQCCKCRNWYHTGCIQNFKYSMLRGDGFFVFCCSICSNDGNEFLRRLQINCVDFMHLVLYNLTAQNNKLQPHKYHHVVKDIYPFVLSQRQTCALPEEWLELNEDDVKNCVFATLKDNAERFVCGREFKRDNYFYGLRNNKPPQAAIPKIYHDICQQAAEINDKFIVERLKLKLCKRAALEGSEQIISNTSSNSNTSEKDDSEDGKFTSDDEIPIKLILEKEKVKNKDTQILDDDSAQHKTQNEVMTENEQQQEIEKNSTATKTTIKSHKRKAFTLSRTYKEPASSSVAAVVKQHRHTNNSANGCESSSDENSSSSRCTSLDLIIPPPKDFLGVNNPFRTVAIPKKSTTDKKIFPFTNNSSSSIFGVPTIRNSVVNASALDFCSNLTALKNAGMLPNLNTTNFARAAGQPRMVRTIKRRLSAKDIMIGPNQEIRRRRTRRLSSNVEVISTTTINPISSFFPINAPTSSSGTHHKTAPTNLRKHNFPAAPMMPQLSSTKTEKIIVAANKQTANINGRRLRLRPQNALPTTDSRRSSLSGASSSSIASSSTSVSASSSRNATPHTTAQYSAESAILSDLQQTVNKYFGVGHLIATGEQFSIHAQRQLSNGQIQLLIEWGVNDENSVNSADSTTNFIDAGEKTISQESS